MNTQIPHRALRSLLNDLDPQARRVALQVCRAYKNPRDIRAYKEIRVEFDRMSLISKRSVRALRKLEKGLMKLEGSIKSTLKGDTRTLLDSLREAHIPDGSPALLPIYEKEPTTKDYLRIRNIPDPAEPLERFIQLQYEVRGLAKKEANFMQNWIQARRRPKRRVFALFSVWGAVQYALQTLFVSRVRGSRLRKYEVEVRIAKILTELDHGGRTIDPYRKDCAAIRASIRRLPDQYKIWCNSFLAHNLKQPRI